MIVLNFKMYEINEKLPEVTSPQIYISSKQEKFQPEGVYSEQIFGPVKKFKCQCGKIFGKMNAGTKCSKCNVLCADNEMRANQFAKIELPQGIHIINPDFKNLIQSIFGQSAIKTVLDQRYYQTNKEQPYYFSLEKFKLFKENKLKKDEKKIEIEVYDISSLYEVFKILKEHPDEKVKNFFYSFLPNPKFFDYIFLDYILVIPPSSRQIIKISSSKALPHEITKNYLEILKNRNKAFSVSDNLYESKPELFGYTVYKYQESVNKIYESILKFNFQNKDSYARESLTGKTIEFSQRSVIVPNPALKAYEIGLHESSIKNLFLPEILNYLFNKYNTNPIHYENFTVMDLLQYVYRSFDNDFHVFLKDEDFEEFLNTNVSKLSTLMERNPSLHKYNITSVQIKKVFKSEDDIQYVKDKKCID